MLIFSILLIILPFIISLDSSDYVMKGEEIEQLEKKAKTLACSFISDSFLLSMSNKEKQLKEILKKNKIIKKDSEADKAIPNFVSALCYSKIRPETANEILIHVSEGKTDLPNRENYKYLFEINSKVDYKSIKKYMDEMNQIMKDIEEEEQSLHEKRKDDPDLDKNIKNLEKKMVRNKHYMENNEEKDKKEEKKNRKKRKEKQKEEIIKEKKEEKNEHKIPRRKKSFSMKEFIKRMNFKTIWAFIISLIIILIFPFIYLQTNNIQIENKDNETKTEEEQKEINEGNKNENEKNKKEPIKNDSDNKEKIE